MNTRRLVLGVSFLILLLLNFYLAIQLKLVLRSVNESASIHKTETTLDSLAINSLKTGLSQIVWLCKSETKDSFKAIFPDNCTEESIVLFIQEGQCAACIKSIIMDLELLQEETSYDNIIIMGNFDSFTNFGKVLEDLDPDLTFTTAWYNFDVPLYCEFPSLFVLNKDYSVDYFFIPELTPELRGEYFYTVLRDYMYKVR